MPQLQGEANETNTLHIDDRDDTFSQNEHNGIKIPAYSPNLDGTPEEIIESILQPDDTLLKLMCWLSLLEVRNCTDVRKLDKSTIFTTSIADYMLKLRTENEAS